MTIAEGITAHAQAIIALAASLPAWPTPIDCLAGTPSALSSLLVAAEQDLTYYNSRCSYFDRQEPNTKAGTVHFIGDSIFDGFDVASACPYALNRGIGGDTMRGVLTRINRLSAANSIHRAGAGVILIGINDLAYEKSVTNLNYMWDSLAPWMTGKWVACHVLPIDSTVFTGCSNGLIDTANAYIDSKFAGNSNVAIVNVKASLAPQGNLLAQYHIGDGLHPSAAGYDIFRAAVTAALAQLGVV